jgi:hypothetical protein
LARMFICQWWLSWRLMCTICYLCVIDRSQNNVLDIRVFVALFFRNSFVVYLLFNICGTFIQRRSWLRHCATSRKVAGSIPDVVIGIFPWHNPSGGTMALGSNQPLTEMSTRNISWEVKAAGE